MRRLVGGALAGALVLAGCTQEYDDDMAMTTTPPLVLETSAPEEAAATSAPTTDAQPAEPVDPATAIPEEELLEQTEWVLGLLEEDATGPAAEESARRFAPTFLEEVSVIQLGTIFAGLRGSAPYTVTSAAQSEGVGRTATLTLHAADQPLVMTLSLDENDQIASLLFQPDTSGEAPQISSWPDLDEALTELGGQSQVVVGDVRDGTCEVTYTTRGLDPGEAFPSGSVVKLLVLAAVADAAQEGDLAWEDELTITPDVTSLPSGVLQDREDGSTVTVREAAELMISISDNTATDLLIEAVGQGALRESVTTAGLDTTRIMPVPTTRQIFQLGWQVDSEVRDRWAEAAVPESREAILADLPEELDVPAAAVTVPVWESGVDWFLTGAEICSLHARLQQQATSGAGEPVREILATNPGLTPPDGVTYQAFKGGSVPGVLALSFYLETSRETEETDGDPDASPPGGVVLVVQTRSEEAIDQMRAVTIIEAGLQHLAQGPG
ncbi:Beta-lactamase [Serinicoccus hydrothermalis]|uniref:Beta-lactamase n=1 Tax=Serinicoccus hydrothermalis TaxID=1758689 RepID=A0A1B1NFI9_9MICO|nr:serine hydrolase [Serinicoccus hydrothermalis]ANS80206.1 Beta-lactamase [Serinicoccus hydrothermalis]